jgi:predicted TIM-barrel fold metal-dependent hydrolase
MWASDYPHSDSTWPHSQKVIERDFSGVPEAELDALVRGNAAALYGL